MFSMSRLTLRSEDRKGRLHDFNGNVVATDRIVRNGSRALLTKMAQLVFSRHPKLPWIAYDGHTRIANFLDKTKSVLEFGSGMSTAWYAERAATVLSLEDNAEWHTKTHASLLALGNVDHRLCKTLDEYLLAGVDEGQKFDFIMVDGTQRYDCLKAALPRLRPGGMLYLDNSDMLGDHVTGDIPAARRELFAYAAEHRHRIETLTDFAPTQLFVNEATILYT